MTMLILLLSILMMMIMVTLSTDKCCEGTCPSGYDKCYSIVKELGVVGPMRCGESCITPDDFDKVKKLEPHMEVANVSNPCFEYGTSS